jgi:hypothetical protein
MVAMLCVADGCQSRAPYISAWEEANDVPTVTPGTERVKRNAEDFGRKRGKKGKGTKVVNNRE